MTKPKIFIFPTNKHGALGNTYQTLAEDGTPLGSHMCTNNNDAKIHIQTHSEDFAEHYPLGYTLEFIEDCTEEFHDALRANVQKYGKKNFDHPRNAKITVVWIDDDGKEHTTVIE